MLGIDIKKLIEELGVVFRRETRNNTELQEYLGHIESNRNYGSEDCIEILRSAAPFLKLMVQERNISAEKVMAHCAKQALPLVFFGKNQSGAYISTNPGKSFDLRHIQDGNVQQKSIKGELPWTAFESGEGGFRVLLFEPLDWIFGVESDEYKRLKGPLSRFFRLMHQERKEVILLYVYALFTGVIALSLPLGIQAIIGFLMGAQVSTSLVLLIVLVLLGAFLTGALHIMQIWVVEAMQQRLFARASLEFAYRFPRMRMDALSEKSPPELANRFFDILTIQKGLPKLLIDLSSSVLQILFGIILLSFYHFTFLVFGLVVIGVVYVMFRLTSPKAMDASLLESDYKYKTANWLQELGRHIELFKLTGNSSLPLETTDKLVAGYIRHRRERFRIIVSQNWFMVAFKVILTAGLLVLGGALVVNQQINIGQFVAGEIVIILIINSVEKFIQGLETVYDVLTAAEKLGKVTDIPLEQHSGRRLSNQLQQGGIGIEARGLSYVSPHSGKSVLKQVQLRIESGEKVCLTGGEGSGKSTLLSLLSGLYQPSAGLVLLDDVPLRNLDAQDVHTLIGETVSQDTIFWGTVFENISMGRPGIGFSEVNEVAKAVGLTQEIQALKKGYDTVLIPDKKGISTSTLRKISLARALIEKPRILLLEDLGLGLGPEQRADLRRLLIDDMSETTLLIVSKNRDMAMACKRLVILDQGSLVYDGKPSELPAGSPFNQVLE
ncbi:MAG: ABC transporter ATP-binding protein [Bacteroidetes bacterium]|nr:ABC transporter ATP-binding protein [Bacteroidota bacterium]